jgi:hypothetical protein
MKEEEVARPKFHVSDRVIYDGIVYKVTGRYQYPDIHTALYDLVEVDPIGAAPREQPRVSETALTLVPVLS